MSQEKNNLPCDECLVLACCKGRFNNLLSKTINESKAAKLIISNCDISYDYCIGQLNLIRSHLELEKNSSLCLLVENPFIKKEKDKKNWVTVL